MLHTILLVAAFISFAAAAIGISARVNLVAVGLALWVLRCVIELFAARLHICSLIVNRRH